MKITCEYCNLSEFKKEGLDYRSFEFHELLQHIFEVHPDEIHKIFRSTIPKIPCKTCNMEFSIDEYFDHLNSDHPEQVRGIIKKIKRDIGDIEYTLKTVDDIIGMISMYMKKDDYGAFLFCIIQAWQMADPYNKEILKDSFATLIKKYHLQQDALDYEAGKK